jgi:hypothetical protein
MDLANALAESMLAVPAEKQGDATIERTQAGTLDPVTDTTTGDRRLRQVVKGWAVPVAPRSKRAGTREDAFAFGVLVTAARCTFEPKPGDRLTWAGETYGISEVYPLPSATKPAAFRLVVRR